MMHECITSPGVSDFETLQILNMQVLLPICLRFFGFIEAVYQYVTFGNVHQSK